MARTRQTKRQRTCTSSTRNIDLGVLSISSDSSDEVLVVNQGTQDIQNEIVVSAVEVVEAQPVTLKSLGLADSSDEEEQDPEQNRTVAQTRTRNANVPTPNPPHNSIARSSESRRFTIRQRIIEGEATVQLLEHDLLSGLVGALKHKKDPFSTLRVAWKETDFKYCENLDQELDFRIHRLRKLVAIPSKYDSNGSIRLWRTLAGTEEE